MPRRSLSLAVACALALAAAACGPAPQRPTLTATGLKFHKPGVTGLPVDVTFRVQNPNANPLAVERFDYEVVVNGQAVGRGFVPDPMVLEPFREREVTSRFTINYFKIPGTVRQVLDQDRMDAVVRGTFVVKGRFRTRQLPFEASGVIPLGRDEAAGAPAPSSR
jgi:LEA14-like dessication related protein